MYKSPIEIIEINDIVNEIVNDINGKFDEAVMVKVKACVNIDKEELIKALNYDRDQYEKGYNDGKLDAVPVVRCKDCLHYRPMVAFDGEGMCDVFQWKSEPMDYCSFAERKEVQE